MRISRVDEPSGSLIARLPERRCVRVERAQRAHDAVVVDAERLPLLRERVDVRALHRAEAAVAAAVVRRADGAAARLRDRAEARGAVGDHHARRAACLALEAHARRRQPRRAAVQERQHRLDELLLRDRAAAQLEVDLDVIGDRSRRLERADELGARVDERDPLLHVGEVPQRLDPAGRGAGADRDEQARLLANLVDPLDVVRRRHRSLDERDVVRAGELGARRLGEVGDLERAGDREQLVLAVEQGELAAVAGGELPHGELRFRGDGAHSSRTSISRSISSNRNTGPSRQISTGPSWQWPQWPSPHCMLRSIEM